MYGHVDQSSQPVSLHVEVVFEPGEYPFHTGSATVDFPLPFRSVGPKLAVDAEDTLLPFPLVAGVRYHHFHSPLRGLLSEPSGGVLRVR